jgi:rhodanese-related sulfurtransferase
MSMHNPDITIRQLHAAQLRGESPALLDVRSAAEYRAGHIPGAQLIPIEELVPEAVPRKFNRPCVGSNETLYITCQAGPRAQRAAERLRQAGYTNLALIEGGTQAWEKAGFPLKRCGASISLERQVQIAIGMLLILKVFLGFSVHELFFALTALVGAGLIIAGVTRWCGMAKLIARMPWNRRKDCQDQASVQTV